jgi:hypothetical protein
MRIEYKVGVPDLVKFNVVHQFLSPLMNGLFIVGALLFSWGHHGIDASFIDLIPTALLWYVGFWLGQAILLALFFSSRTADSVLTEHVLEIREKGLFESTKFNESTFFWAGVQKAVRRPGFVAVYISQHQAHVIPAKSFKSPEQMDRFVALVQEKIRAV